MIPTADEGYAVVASTGAVHRRYATHAPGARRTRTLAGVGVLLNGSEPQVCRRCWPSYRKPRVRKVTA